MWQLIISGPGYFDTRYELPEGFTHIGRADENDVVLSGDLISRRHARLRVTGGELFAEDLGSRNGTQLNGRPLAGIQPLKAGDALAIGDNTLSVQQRGVPELTSAEPNRRTTAVKRVGGGALGDTVIVARDLRDSTVRQALSTPSGAEAGRGVPTEWLVSLYQIAERLSSARALGEFLDDAADNLMERTNATTAVVLLRYPSGTMVPASVRHRGELEPGEVPVSDAIVEAALEQGAALAVANPRLDERFAHRESVIMYAPDQVLCIPVRGDSGDVGVLYLNRPFGSSEESAQVLDFCTAVAHLVSTGIEKFRGPAKRDERLRRSLERFHAPEIVERRAAELARPGRTAPTLLEERVCTVVFAELAEFASLAESLGPQRAMEILNDFHERMTSIAFSFEGTAANFRGESLTAVYGAPWTLGDEQVRAVRSAVAMRAEWDSAIHRHAPAERRRLRIGVATGRVLAGIVGAESRLDFTVVGPAAQLAEWIADSAEPGQVLITAKTQAAVAGRFAMSALGERIVRAPDVRVSIFEVLEEDVANITLSGTR